MNPVAHWVHIDLRRFCLFFRYGTEYLCNRKFSHFLIHSLYASSFFHNINQNYSVVRHSKSWEIIDKIKKEIKTSIFFQVDSAVFYFFVCFIFFLESYFFFLVESHRLWQRVFLFYLLKLFFNKFPPQVFEPVNQKSNACFFTIKSVQAFQNSSQLPNIMLWQSLLTNT